MDAASNMTYELYNNEASIKIVPQQEGATVILLKSAIKEISVVRQDVIKLGGKSCGDSKYLRYRSITYPSAVSALALVNLISEWLTNEDPTPPME